MTALPITLAYGDGIGPEIMEATLRILQEAGAQLKIDTIEIGEQVYKRGSATGIPADAWESLRRTKILVKGPILAPDSEHEQAFYHTLKENLGDELKIIEPPSAPLQEPDPRPLLESILAILEPEIAAKIRRALAQAEGENLTAAILGCTEYTEAVIERLR